MKNIWFMLLTVCTMFAFSACSDDDEKNPTNPVSNAKVPATVQIGEEMIITGTGFTAPGIALYLEDAEKKSDEIGCHIQCRRRHMHRTGTDSRNFRCHPDPRRA